MGYNNRSISPAPLAHLAQRFKYDSIEEQISKQIAENDRLQQEFLETRKLQKLKRLPTPKSKYHN